MTVNGIIRRVDDLGRIVIPKEFRRECGIKAGDPLEIRYDKKMQTITLKYYKTREELREEWVNKWYKEYNASSATSRRVGDMTIVAWNSRIEIARCRCGDTYERRVGDAVCMAKLCGERIPEYI